MFFEYFRPGLYFPPINVLKINTLLPPLLTLYAIFKDDNISNAEFLQLKSTRWLLFYIFLIIISILISDVTFYAYNYFLQIFGYFMVYFILIKYIKNLEQLKNLFRLLIVIHIFILGLNPDVILSRKEVI